MSNWKKTWNRDEAQKVFDELKKMSTESTSPSTPSPSTPSPSTPPAHSSTPRRDEEEGVFGALKPLDDSLMPKWVRSSTLKRDKGEEVLGPLQPKSAGSSTPKRKVRESTYLTSTKSSQAKGGKKYQSSQDEGLQFQ